MTYNVFSGTLNPTHSLTRQLMPSLTKRCVRRHFVTTSFVLVDGSAWSRSFCGFFVVVTVIIFYSVKKLKMMLTSLGEYF